MLCSFNAIKTENILHVGKDRKFVNKLIISCENNMFLENKSENKVDDSQQMVNGELVWTSYNLKNI